MRSIPINPILLLILLHAWARVKKMPSDSAVGAGFDANLPGWPDSVAISRNFRKWLAPQLRIEGLSVESRSWERALASPLFQQSHTQKCKAPSELSRLWGSESAPVLSTSADIKSLKVDETLHAIGLLWSPQWASALPGDVLELISQAHQNSVQVWMHVPPNYSECPISEDTLRQSTQVGWSWWFQPPAKSDELERWFNQYRPAWGFWLCSPTSDQWAWPWMDIFSRCLVSKMGARAFDRTWISDARQKSSWAKIEDQSWRRACEVLGGEGVAQELLAQALLYLVKNHQDFR